MNDKRQFVRKIIAWATLGGILGAVFSIFLAGIPGFVHAITVIVGVGPYHPVSDVSEILYSILFLVFLSMFYYGIPLVAYGAFVGIFIATLRFLWANQFNRTNLKITYSLVGLCYLIFVSVSIYQLQQDKTQIDSRYNQIRLAISGKDYRDAFMYTTPEYRKSHTEKQLVADFLYGNLWPLHNKRYIDISGNRAVLYVDEYNFWTIFNGGPVLELEKIDGVWYFTGNNEMLQD